MYKHTHKKTIFVGVSGGVDSSVSAALLKNQGHHVVGVFIRTWQPEWIACTWTDERRDAMRVCASLDIPFVELDLEREYKEGVADYMITEYKQGRTPNPDVMCNREVKFGGFLTWALAHGADYIATGHYVDRKTLDNGAIAMLRGNDTVKDQSYFLWTLEQDQLKHILFPVGNIPKSRVRMLAKKYKLPTATKKDSQGICFIGDINMKDFLRHYIDEQPGSVLDHHGHSIGEHTVSMYYTIGELHGFTITEKGTDDKPYYVIDKNIDDNTITVSQDPLHHTRPHTSFLLKDIIDNQQVLQSGITIECQIRYRGDIKKIDILSYDTEQKTMKIAFHEVDPTLALGQSIVLYRGNVCLGGGILDSFM